MNRLKELRLAHGFKSQKELAEVLFVNQTAVSQWERGVTMPSGQMLLKLSSMYGVSMDYLLGNSNEPAIEQKEKPPTNEREGLDPMEEKLMQYVRAMTPDQKQLLLAQMQVMSEQNK